MDQLRTAGVSAEDIELAREFLVPESINASEDEVILDITAAWNLVREVHKRKGAAL